MDVLTDGKYSDQGSDPQGKWFFQSPDVDLGDSTEMQRQPGSLMSLVKTNMGHTRTCKHREQVSIIWPWFCLNLSTSPSGGSSRPYDEWQANL